MAYLIIDLDLTLICAQGAEQLLDRRAHTLHPAPAIVSIINPVEASDIIENACTEHDGIIILTAGCWSEIYIKQLLKQQLNVSPATQEKIDKCLFLNPVNTMLDFIGLSLEEVAKLRKIDRYYRMLVKNPDLKSKHCVFLDDDEIHIESFASEPRVTAIRATTDTPTKAFYQETINAMARAKRRENGEVITPVLAVKPDSDTDDSYDELSDDRPVSTPVILTSASTFFAPAQRNRSNSAPERPLLKL